MAEDQKLYGTLLAIEVCDIIRSHLRVYGDTTNGRITKTILSKCQSDKKVDTTRLYRRVVKITSDLAKSGKISRELIKDQNHRNTYKITDYAS